MTFKKNTLIPYLQPRGSHPFPGSFCSLLVVSLPVIWFLDCITLAVIFTSCSLSIPGWLLLGLLCMSIRALLGAQSPAQNKALSGSPKPCSPSCARCHPSAPSSQPTFLHLHVAARRILRCHQEPALLLPCSARQGQCGLWGWEVVCSSMKPSRVALLLPFKVITSRNDKLLTNYTLSLRPDATNEISVSCFQLIPLLRK